MASFFTSSKKPDNRTEQTECRICWRPFTEREPYMLRTLSCGHTSCKECLNEWTKAPNGRECPYCTQATNPPALLYPSLFTNKYYNINGELQNALITIPKANILSLGIQDWADNWNDWRWEEFDRQQEILTEEQYLHNTRFLDHDEKETYTKRIKNVCYEAELGRINYIINYLSSPVPYQYVRDKEKRINDGLIRRRILRSWGYTPSEAMSYDDDFKKSTITLEQLMPLKDKLIKNFTIPIIKIPNSNLR